MNIKIKYCIDPKIYQKHFDLNKSEVAKIYKIDRSDFTNLVSYKLTRQKRYLKQIPDEFLEPVIWNVKTKKITRFKDAKKKEEKELIKIFKENNDR